jgi:hypothetical protein
MLIGNVLARFPITQSSRRSGRVLENSHFLLFIFFMAVCNYFCYIMLPHALYTAKEARSRLHFILLEECLGSCAHISISIYGFQLSQVHGFMCNSSEHAAIMLMRERLERCALCGEQTHIYYIHKAGALSLMKLIIGVALVNKTSFFTASGTKGLFLPLQAASAVINPLSLASRPAICTNHTPRTHHAENLS